MNKLPRIALAAALAAALTAGMATADAATLRTDSTIDADVVRLGDLFDDVGDRADSVVGRAPAPGRRAVYDAAFLGRIAQSFQLPWRPASAFDRATVTRSSTVINAEAVRQILTPVLTARSNAERIEVELDNRQIEVHLPAGQPATLAIEQISFDPVQSRFSAMLIGADQTRIPVSGRAVGIVEVPVLTRRIKPGEVIGAADIGWMETRQTRSSTEVIRDQSQLIGLTPRRAITTNMPIRPGDIQQPQLVTKNSLVTVTLQTRSMMLSAQGRALQEGGMGDVIRIVNTMSNRTIEATVTGPNQVTVSTPGAIALN